MKVQVQNDKLIVDNSRMQGMVGGAVCLVVGLVFLVGFKLYVDDPTGVLVAEILGPLIALAGLWAILSAKSEHTILARSGEGSVVTKSLVTHAKPELLAAGEPASVQHQVVVTRSRSVNNGGWTHRCLMSVRVQTHAGRRILVGRKTKGGGRITRNEYDFQVASLNPLPLKSQAEQIATFLNVPLQTEVIERRQMTGWKLSKRETDY